MNSKLTKKTMFEQKSALRKGRILCLLLTFCMIFSITPLHAFAEGTGSGGANEAIVMPGIADEDSSSSKQPGETSEAEEMSEIPINQADTKISDVSVLMETQASTPVTVNDFNGLVAAITAVAEGEECVIELEEGSYSYDSQITVKDNKSITIRSKSNKVNLNSMTNKDPRFGITGGATLILENIVLDGTGVYVGNFLGAGMFIMNDGATIQNTSSYPGVTVGENGTFEMQGGTITENTTLYGAGVQVLNKGTFNMHNGTISNNIAPQGAGVFVEGGGMFTMNGGTISNNIAEENGGGIYAVNLDNLTVANTVDFGGNLASVAHADAPPNPNVQANSVSINFGDTSNKNPLNNFDVNYTSGTPYYQVTYVANNGTHDTYPAAIKANGDHVVLSNSETDFDGAGKTFAGWNTQANGEGTAYEVSASISGVSENITLFAVWQVKTFTVTYKSNGGVYTADIIDSLVIGDRLAGKDVDGSNIYPQSVSIDVAGPSYRPADGFFPLLMTYRHIAWNTEADATGDWFRGGYTISEDTPSELTLYAQWLYLPNASALLNAKPTPIIKLNGSSEYSDHTTPLVLNNLTDLETITGEVNFDDVEKAMSLMWGRIDEFTTSEETVKIRLDKRLTYENEVILTFKSSSLKPKDETPYTVTAPGEYEVAIDTTNSTYVDCSGNECVITLPVQLVDKQTIYDMSFEEFMQPVSLEFEGIYIEEDSFETIGMSNNRLVSVSGSFSMKLSALSLSGTFANNGTAQYMEFAAPKYALSYENLGGASNSNPETYTYGVGVSSFEDPGARTGYTFTGWYDDPSAGTKMTEISSTAKDSMTLYARWMLNNYTVTFDAGEHGTMVPDPHTEKVDHGDKVVDVPEITADIGYVFSGWSNGNGIYDKVAVANYLITDEMTFTAQYADSAHAIVVFNYNGGNVNGESFSLSNGKPGTSYSIPTPTRTGYTFKGWSPETPSGVYGTAESITTYTAQWEILSVEYQFIDIFGTFTGTGELTGRINGSYEKFVRLLVNGEELNSSNYTTAEGSTIITLKESYLKTLSNGIYAITGEYTDGQAKTTMTINVTSTNSSDPVDTVDTKGVALFAKTGDANNFALLTILLCISFAVGACVLWKIRRKEHRQKE